MKRALLALCLVAAAAAWRTAVASDQNPFAVTKCDAEPAVVGTIRLTQPVLADGQAIASGVYQVRATSEHPTPAAGQSGTGECWVQLLQNGQIVGREVATVIPDSEIADVAKGPRPAPNAARVDVLKGGDYLRAWINYGGANYIVNFPIVGRPKGSRYDDL